MVGTVRSEHLEPGSAISNMFDGAQLGDVDDLNSFSVTLEPHEGLSLLVEPPPAEEPPQVS
jgi:hypothetical protein